MTPLLRAVLYGLANLKEGLATLHTCATIYCFLFASAVRNARFRWVVSRNGI